MYKGHACDALKALLQGPYTWYAARLKASFKGSGTNDRSVCRILGGHSKAEVQRIAAAYEDKYSVPLKDDLRKELSGDYKRLAIAWVDLPDQLAQPRRMCKLPRAEPPASEPEPPPKEAELPVAQAVPVP
eukprot:7376329-Prymnesium_polylepis.1